MTIPKDSIPRTESGEGKFLGLRALPSPGMHSLRSGRSSEIFQITRALWMQLPLSISDALTGVGTVAQAGAAQSIYSRHPAIRQRPCSPFFSSGLGSEIGRA